MTIQKKSLISSLNTTKKAIVASSPAAGSAAPTTVKAGRKDGLNSRLAMKGSAMQRLAKK